MNKSIPVLPSIGVAVFTALFLLCSYKAKPDFYISTSSAGAGSQADSFVLPNTFEDFSHYVEGVTLENNMLIGKPIITMDGKYLTVGKLGFGYREEETNQSKLTGRKDNVWMLRGTIYSDQAIRTYIDFDRKPPKEDENLDAESTIGFGFEYRW